jgi:hypothetical protein
MEGKKGSRDVDRQALRFEIDRRRLEEEIIIPRYAKVTANDEISRLSSVSVADSAFALAARARARSRILIAGDSHRFACEFPRAS